MRVLAIRIKNLASLDDAIIDFTTEPLNNAGIFAITGPTGAGKSTILDALCLALYAKTPRYRSAETGIDVPDVKGSTIKQDDVRGILRDGTAEGFAEVDFVGIDGQHYRANWNVRRARGKADGNLQNYDVTLKNITSNEDIPGKKSELLIATERLVGLTFEQFTRSVLLAQGDFTAFLKANKDEKSSLLEKLTGTHIYSEISKRIFDHHRDEQQILRDLNTMRDGIQTLTTDELTSLNEQRAALAITIQELEKELAILNKETAWHEQQSNIQSNVVSAQAEYDKASAAKTEAASREKHFEQIVRVQPARSIIHKLDDVREQLSVKSRQSQEVFDKLAELKLQKEQLDAAVNAATEALKEKIQEEETAGPLLDAAKRLDIQLSEKTAQVKLALEEANAAQSRQTQHSEMLRQTEAQLAIVSNEITKLSQWKTENESRRPIAEQEKIIRTRLNDASKILNNLDLYNQRLQKAKGEITTHKEKILKLNGQLNAIQQTVQLSQEDSGKLEAFLSDIDIKKLEDDKQALDAGVSDLISAEAHWRVLHIAMNENQSLLQSLDQNKKELALHTEKLAETKKLFASKQSERDASLKMLESARLTATASVEQIREQLIADEPCPVCGSLEHPYAIHNPALDKILDELEKQYKQIDAEYAELLKNQSSLDQVCVSLNKTITKQETDLPVKTNTVRDLEDKWKSFLIYDESNEITTEDRSSWLSQRLKEQKTDQDTLQKQLTNYRNKKQELEKLKTELSAHAAKANEIQNQIKDLDRSVASLEEQNTNTATEQQNATSSLNTFKQDLSAYFPTADWFENWQTDSQAFVTRIEKFSIDWRSNLTKIDENNTKHKVVEEKLKGIKNQSENIEEEIRAKGNKLSKLQSQQTEISNERKSIFNGEPASHIESKLKAEITTARKALEEKSKETEKLQQEMTANAARSGQLEKDKTALSEQQQKFKEELNTWLQKHNQQHGTSFTEVELLPLLNLTSEWIESERNSLRTIDDTLTKNRSVLEERTQILQSHTQQRLSERSLEELTARLAEVQGLFRQNTQTASEIGFKITSDEANRKSHKTLLQQIEKQSMVVDNWGKLNEVIGSADGKKFRQIAQEYTLDVLLSYANVQLEVLSKRYVLQRVPNSLGLQVIDKDMGDEVRTVYSLSGGESFLVSLALALGLASLSSSKMKVESLFIDEGFGSLDPSTLNIAMDALERLHNQGRKVGVISHVQEMTERIPVQIEVRKQQRGQSKVETIGLNKI